MELTPIQKQIITALIDLSRKKNEVIKGEDIAEIIGRSPGTVRNQMQSMKALELVEGVPGPKGGYKPTGNAYEAVSLDKLDEEAIVCIYRNGILIEGATVSDIDFTSLRHPILCRAAVKVLGDTHDIHTGDKIQVGPTPVNNLVIRGEVYGRDDTDNVVLCNINEIVSLPKKPIKEYMSKKILYVDANATLQKAALILTEQNIHGAPVKENEKVIGIVTFKDIGRALADGKIRSKVRDVMVKSTISIDGNRPLYEAIKVLDKYKVGLLIVTDGEEAIGIISKTDILNELAVY
ncbi:MAG: CBS domain-containing protein [Methanocellales archaeon]|nr:CBS domain-containing protein [Methanocellales archaeon]MDD3421292.1 CBS domain-containing protein [Methanocellales archaeon]MDD4898477.1 CBS domain-containing protein [Methanocellales archaeon]MDD5447230.1 CBS domain-containing protein [Methanocellales archaeon]